MPITIGANISSLTLQRHLGEHTQRLQTSLARLASGQRINSAGDDPAGLAVASRLNTDARVYTRGIKNLNDGLSALNIAQGALEELASISQRQLELAEQAANGSLSFKQRLALHKESFQLTKEFNRIVGSTSFNGLNLIDGSITSGISLQAGYQSSGVIIVDPTSGLTRNAGDGTFTATTTTASGGPGGAYDMATGDFNGDGKLDYAAGAWTGGVWVNLGNGDGTFGASVTTAGLAQTKSIEVADVNGDGLDDLITLADAGIRVLMSDGDGTFTQSDSFTVPGSYNHSMSAADFTGDGRVDFIAQDGSTGNLYLYAGNGNGTFSSAALIGNTAYAYGSAAGDVNGDGRNDLIVADISGTFLLTSQGNGTFVKTQVATGDTRSVAVADLDGDGILDILSTVTGASMMKISKGNGDGTFASTGNYNFSSGLANEFYQKITVGDFNGDGLPDAAIAVREQLSSSGTVLLYMNNGDGTFGASTNLGALSDSISIANGDFNNDGVNDIVVPNTWTSVRYFKGDVRLLTYAPFQNLTTVDTARDALETSKAQVARISSALGTLGGYQSRVSVAINSLESMVASLIEAKSRIEDVDVALETAELVKQQILQKAGVALLAQANIQPQIAWSLLSGSLKNSR